MSIAEKLTTIAENEQKVYEAGKKAEYNEFWDAFQSNGKRTNYYRAFANHNSASTALGWNSVTFRPKYDLRPSSAAQGFMYLQVDDLDAHLKECGIVFDSSKCSNLQQAFQSATIIVFPTLHLKDDVNARNIFNLCSKLTTIRKIIFEINTDVSLGSAFNDCSKLANIEEVEGAIVINISFSSSPLTVKSMKNIILHLADYSGTDSEFTYKVIFSSACLTTLEAEGATSPNGNTWVDYIADLGWLTV